VCTPQGPELQIDVSTLKRRALLLEVSTPQHRVLSCTWTCLDNSSLHVMLLYLSTLQRYIMHLDVSTMELSFTWACLHSESCAAPGTVYITAQRPELHLNLSTPQSSELQQWNLNRFLNKPYHFLFDLASLQMNYVCFAQICEV
jgi:hypothetical protein